MTTAKIVDAAVTKAKLSTALQASIDKADLSQSAAQVQAIANAAAAAIVSSAPASLDTLQELATALGNDPNFATTVSTLIGTKAPLASPAFTGTTPTVNGTSVVVETDTRLTNSRTPLGTTQSVWNTGTSNSTNYGLTPAELRTATVTAIGITDPKSSIGGVSIVLGNDAALYNTRTPTTGTVPYDITYAAQSGARLVGLGDVPAGIKLKRAVTFSEVTFHCETADASGNLVAEIRKNGTAVSGTSTTIAAANQVAGGTSSGTWAFAAGDILTIYVTGVGTTPGKGLVADLKGLA
ncbi:hypothetical protein [Rhodococcus globerulus]|uniref:Uncharacterized protein n=1 Tax=Rhodococcus globerulus TaxID=33008 RepID=A0ABU4C4H1_RHOGO|nr:hypothetical protein [Rhodococcus globerulus]MDV6271118.1 hypothetical protein [Rhodococcus globerulus]